MFIGIEGIARKVTGAHIGVDGVSRMVKKAYIGVDGVARLAWEAGGSSEGGTDSTTGVRAYLYNGVKLPELPEWDRVAYPYALMFYFDASAYVSGTTIAKLYLFDKEAHYVGLMKFSGVNTVVRYDLVSDIKLAEYAELANIAETITQANVWTYNKTEAYAEDDSFRTPTTSYIIWSNYDVVKSSDGSIISTASDPVPLYRYNGVELPELPEWNKETHPYVYMSVDPILYISSVPFVSKSETNGRTGYFAKDVQYTSLLDDGTEWKPFTVSTQDYATEPGGRSAKWTNADIYSVAGTLLLTASDPQPVYM